MDKYAAEFFGTFWLVLGGCGSAVLAAAFPDVGIGLLGVSLAFGLTVLTMAYAIGHISGCHLNPAVSIGLWAGGRLPAKDLVPYIVSQVLGGIVAGAVLYVIASGQAGFDVSAGFASNGYAEHSPGGYTLVSALVTEIVMTLMFLIIILGATDKRAPAGFAPIAIGLGLTQHVGILRGLIQSRLRLGVWKRRLLADPTRIMEAYLACTQFPQDIRPPL